jgi:sulfur-oxidizing protein SoxA
MAARPTSLDARFHGHDVIPARAGIQGFAPILDMSQFLPLILAICALLSFTKAGPLAAEDLSPYVVEDRRSGYTYLSQENQQLQNDAFANPGQLWMEKGRELWQESEGFAHVSCVSCHGDATKSMRGVRTRYPRFDARSNKLMNLELQINRCREERQHAAPYPYESEALLALTTFIGFQSRGLPVDVRIDGPAQPFFAAGRAFFMRRRGQLDLACTHCHDQYAGQRLRGDVISQGQINGFPIYRHTWQTLGSTHRMFAWCNSAIRAQSLPLGADEYVNLELYLAWRGRGLPVETPAVRR